MRIFILAIGTRGDVEMFLNLGEVLFRRGHQIVVGTSTFFAEHVKSRNLSWVQVGNGTSPEMGQVLRATSAISVLDRTNYFIQHWVQPQLDAGVQTIIAYAQSANYFVSNLKMRLRRRGKMIPCAFVTYEVPDPSSPLESAATAEESQQILDLVAMNRELVDPNRAWSDKYCFTGFWTNRKAEQFVPVARIAQFLDDGPAPVVVTFGSMTPAVQPDFLEMIARSVIDAGARAIFLGGLAPSKTVSARLEFTDEEIPYSWLFHKAACVVHHGGVGTAASAIEAGVQSIILPWIAAQDRLAQVLSTTGLASLINRSTIVSGTMTKIIEETLADQQRRALAREWADRLVQENGLELAAEAIESHVARL